MNIFWHELHSYGISDVFFFSRLSNSSINLSPDKLFWVGVAECLVARSSVSPRLTEIGTCGFSYASSVVTSVPCVCRGAIRNHRRWLWGKFSFPVLEESLANLGLLPSISRWHGSRLREELLCAPLLQKRLVSCFSVVYFFCPSFG